jgi:ribonuclease HII
MRPTFSRERAAMKRGVFPVAGCDEAGRGPLAGPVVAAAVILDPRRIPKGLNDSKKLNAETRAALYEKICASAQVAIAIAPPSRIEVDNIRGASLWALARAVKALPVPPSFVFVDGIDRIDVACECRAVDQRRCAGALDRGGLDRRKVTRDRLMGCLGAAPSGLRLRAPHGLFGAGAIRGAQPARALRASPPQFAPVAALLGPAGAGAEIDETAQLSL